MRPERFDKERLVAVDVLSCDQDASLIDAQLAAKTVDVSEAGMKMSMYVALPEKARIALLLGNEPSQFHLQGEVRWLRDDGETCVGILLDKQSQDYLRWREVFADF